ncbi:MAG: crossover junction endodeoxyribonuclease RuvC [Victivallaceae bacterium]|nr:crossover junction endodeoxyribonuclease RuvC [Victivallaceae bacterium]
MVVLGIDPAIRTTGYGVIGEENGRLSVIDCGTIVNKPKMSHSECLYRLYNGVAELISNYHPDAAAIESPFVGRNASTAIILGMARGAIVSALANENIPVYSYTPGMGKQALTGRTMAEKPQVAIMISAEFGIDIDMIPLDSTDAISIAVCHAQRARHPEFGKLGNPI